MNKKLVKHKEFERYISTKLVICVYFILEIQKNPCYNVFVARALFLAERKEF